MCRERDDTSGPDKIKGAIADGGGLCDSQESNRIRQRDDLRWNKTNHLGVVDLVPDRGSVPELGMNNLLTHLEVKVPR